MIWPRYSFPDADCCGSGPVCRLQTLFRSKRRRRELSRPLSPPSPPRAMAAGSLPLFFRRPCSGRQLRQWRYRPCVSPIGSSRAGELGALYQLPLILTRRGILESAMICFGVANDGGLRCRSHFEETLRQLSFAARRNSKDSGQARRLLALAAIYDGSTRTEAAKIGGVTLQIVRDWVMRVQPWSLRAHRRQGAGSNAAPDERAPRSPGSHGRWPDPCRSWRGALAACRPLPANI